jgi:predicted membrane protein
MPINPKRITALNLLAATGMWRSNYAPPLLRMLWMCGIDVPPPHFVPFRVNAVMFGATFAVAFGAVKRLIEGPDIARSLFAVLLELVVVGALFGLLMAGLFERGKQKFRLPLWRDL